MTFGTITNVIGTVVFDVMNRAHLDMFSTTTSGALGAIRGEGGKLRFGKHGENLHIDPVKLNLPDLPDLPGSGLPNLDVPKLPLTESSGAPQWPVMETSPVNHSDLGIPPATETAPGADAAPGVGTTTPGPGMVPATSTPATGASPTARTAPGTGMGQGTGTAPAIGTVSGSGPSPTEQSGGGRTAAPAGQASALDPGHQTPSGLASSAAMPQTAWEAGQEGAAAAPVTGGRGLPGFETTSVNQPAEAPAPHEATTASAPHTAAPAPHAEVPVDSSTAQLVQEPATVPAPGEHVGEHVGGHLGLPHVPEPFDASQLPDPSPRALVQDLPSVPGLRPDSPQPQVHHRVDELSRIARSA
ncbi:hypothetical protein ABZZ74_54325, partial [Streptomyces sp. NPDC006476]